MGWLKLAGEHHKRADKPAAARRAPVVLSEIYGRPIPATARLLDRYLRSGHLPLRDPEHPDRVVTVDLPLAADAFGCDLDVTHRYLHGLHAIGELAVDEHGTVELINARE